MDPRFGGMDVLDVWLVDQVRRTGSITAAAEVCGLGQSGATTRLRRLEGSLGFRIYQGQARGSKLTEEGKLLADHCSRVLKSLAQLVEELDKR